jgi:hypothetical protein
MTLDALITEQFAAEDDTCPICFMEQYLHSPMCPNHPDWGNDEIETDQNFDFEPDLIDESIEG